MEPGFENHRDHAAALEAELATARAGRAAALAELAVAKAREADDQAIILRQKVYIEKLQRELRGQKSERTARLIAQMELMLEDAEATATEDELAAEMAVAAASAIAVTGFTRKRPVKKPFPEHLPRERVVVPGPVACNCCGGERLRKIGEDITETMESIPRSWKVIQTVREKFTGRDCEKISQAPAPFHVIPRGWAGPGLLAMMLCDKFGQHIPLNRQVEGFALEGVPISLSTAADAMGACCQILDPLVRRIESHTFASERIHGDDTTVPVLALGKTVTGRIWSYVRDDSPFGGTAPPSVMFYYSRDRAGEHPQAHLANYSGILQADAYTGYGQLYLPERSPGPLYEAACWAHARRRIDTLLDIERHINGRTADERKAIRRQLSRPLIDDMEIWIREHRARLPRDNDLAKAFDYMLKRWESFTRFLDDGHICLSNNCAERSLRGVALGRKPGYLPVPTAEGKGRQPCTA
jgi:transposase